MCVCVCGEADCSSARHIRTRLRHSAASDDRWNASYQLREEWHLGRKSLFWTCITAVGCWLDGSIVAKWLRRQDAFLLQTGTWFCHWKCRWSNNGAWPWRRHDDLRGTVYIKLFLCCILVFQLISKFDLNM